MKTKAFMILPILGLAACGGSGGGDMVEEVEGVDFEISDGVLDDFEVPTEAQIAGLPTEVAATVNAFIESNENDILTPVLPVGEALFVGPWAMGQSEGGDQLVGGTLSLDVDFDSGDEFLSGRLDVEYAFDDDGAALIVVRNPLEEFDVDINGVVANGAISGNMSGRFDVRTANDTALETVNVGGFIDGSFTGEGATGAIGTLSARFDYSDNTNDNFDGLFQIDRQ